MKLSVLFIKIICCHVSCCDDLINNHHANILNTIHFFPCTIPYTSITFRLQFVHNFFNFDKIALLYHVVLHLVWLDFPTFNFVSIIKKIKTALTNEKRNVFLMFSYIRSNKMFFCYTNYMFHFILWLCATCSLNLVWLQLSLYLLGC